MVSWDHPRSRGVYVMGTKSWRTLQGSSPLARGLRHATLGAVCPAGIIPARAGFTSRALRGRTPAQDHPRSRGVYQDGKPGPWSRPGSSPLARGLPKQPEPTPAPSGIIPARAGFTSGTTGRRSQQRDHPRSRGVYPGVQVPHPQGDGSSPLARGLLTAPSKVRSLFRIIPARAGFTRADRRLH